MTGLVLCTSIVDVDDHKTDSWHPERAARLSAVSAALDHDEIRDVVSTFAARQASVDDLARAHDRQYLDALRQFVEAGGGSLDPDTSTSRGSWETARWAAGAGLAAIDQLASIEANAAFVGIRPPGHHATATQAMGFCLVNNVAVVAAGLADRGERVAILDWDVHHGNGTQDIFWNDPRVLYASMHEHPAFPGTGRADEVGGPDALGSTVNVPLPPYATGDAALAAIEEIIAPAITEFEPAWLLISAGFDAHRADPLANLEWTAGDYAALAGQARQLTAPTGRTIVLLEGGYDSNALSASVTATVAALAGVEEHRTEQQSSGGPGREAVRTAAELRRRALDGG